MDWVKGTFKRKIIGRKKLKRNQSGKFKLLSVNYDLFTEDKTAINFKQKIENIRTLLNSWIYRDLAYMEKNNSNKIFSNANLNPISRCFAQPFR